jgi:lipoyl-dependent peroxiredoxin subunit D
MIVATPTEVWIEELQLPQNESKVIFDRLQGSPWLRDLKLNIKSVLEGEHLDAKERVLLCLSIAGNARDHTLVTAFSELATKTGTRNTEIAEALACASLLSANNVLYRFRHFTGKDSYAKMPARLRMNIMLKPETGKEFFELMSLAVSAVNGCEVCVNAHEQSLLGMGCTELRIWEAIRIASVVQSLCKVV